MMVYLLVLLVMVADGHTRFVNITLVGLTGKLSVFHYFLGQTI